MIRVSAPGRGCVKNQIEKQKVGNQSTRTNHRPSWWGSQVKAGGLPGQFETTIPISTKAKWFSHTLGRLRLSKLLDHSIR